MGGSKKCHVLFDGSLPSTINIHFYLNSDNSISNALQIFGSDDQESKFLPHMTFCPWPVFRNQGFHFALEDFSKNSLKEIWDSFSVSISPTFFKQVFCMKVFFTAFLCWQFGFCNFLAKGNQHKSCLGIHGEIDYRILLFSLHVHCWRSWSTFLKPDELT